jgi:hypothetical protein
LILSLYNIQKKDTNVNVKLRKKDNPTGYETGGTSLNKFSAGV